MKRNKKWTFMVLGFMIATMLILSACGVQEGSDIPEDGPIQVTATTGMVGDAVKNVGGKRVEVTTLMGPGVDPHLYKASQGDIKKLDDAHMIFYNGIHLEGKMTEILDKISKEKPVIAVAEKIDKKDLIKTGDNEYDPHVWFDVDLWIQTVKRVETELSNADPKHKEDYQKRANDYIKKLEELDRYAEKQIKSIPQERRVLVTAHDAFGYFGKAYDIEVVGLQGISTASEYGLKDVQRIVKLLVDREIKAVFVESSVPKRSIQAVVKGTEKKGHKISIGGELFSDAMGKEGTVEGTYVGMVRHNVDTIVSALK